MSALIRSAPKAATLSRIFLRGAATRTESDLLGELQVPADHYYGVQTMRGYLSYDHAWLPELRYYRKETL